MRIDDPRKGESEKQELGEKGVEKAKKSGKKSSEKRELKIQKIENGVVIDHIKPGLALSVIRVLGITGDPGFTITLAIHVPSKKMGAKDIVKIEGKFPTDEELARIALISPKATINIIRNYIVHQKLFISPPEEIVGIVRCSNPACISNLEREPITPKFSLVSSDPVLIRCHYCKREMGEEVVNNII